MKIRSPHPPCNGLERGGTRNLATCGISATLTLAMRPHLLLSALLLLSLSRLAGAEPDFPLTADSKPQPDVPKGELIKGGHVSGNNINGTRYEDLNVYPGTEREYQIYIPHGLDRSKPAAFMVFQDGVIYQAPVVLDNLIAKKEIPPLIGIFVKPGVVPPPDEHALPRFNRSFEYDSISDTYARFLLHELLPSIEKKHGLKLSTDPNDAAIAGNSSGGIAAFMVAWHRPDRFRRVFTGVGTYVGIHGADRLPVLVRKMEPKPLRIFLQSGTGDNNLYCGDWWMANQMMERSLTWAGYDVNHAWGEGGHNQKHASQVFPGAMRWLWRDWQTSREIKANPKGESRWRGYEVAEPGEWESVYAIDKDNAWSLRSITPTSDGSLYFNQYFRKANSDTWENALMRLTPEGMQTRVPLHWERIQAIAAAPEGKLRVAVWNPKTSSTKPAEILSLTTDGKESGSRVVATKGSGNDRPVTQALCVSHDGWCFFTDESEAMIFWSSPEGAVGDIRDNATSLLGSIRSICLSPDESLLYATGYGGHQTLTVFHVSKGILALRSGQEFYRLEPSLSDSQGDVAAEGMCVDADGRLYVATTMGVQVCDQAGRVNFIIPTPAQPYDVCFAGKNLKELHIVCKGAIYKRPMKVRGVISGQMPPIKPAAPKL